MESFDQKKSQKQTNLISLIDQTFSRSKEQLSAIKFIKEVIASVQSYADFQQYKNDVLEALTDTEQTILVTIEDMSHALNAKEYYEEKRLNDMHHSSDMGIIENNTKPSYEINTASLGLRFNYDCYLNLEKNNKVKEDQMQLRDNDQQQQQQQKQEQKEKRVLNFDYSSKNSIDAISRFANEKKEIQSSIDGGGISCPISIDRVKISEANTPYDMTFNPSFNKQDTILDSNQQSDTNKLIKTNEYNSDRNNKANMLDTIPQPQESNLREMPSKQNEIITNDPIQNSSMIKQKASRLTDLIMKINSEQEIYEIILQLFGEDILDNLMSSKVSDEFVGNVEKSVKEIERLRDKDLKEDSIKSQGNIGQNLQLKMNEELFYETPISNYRPVPIQINNIQTVKAKSFSDELLISNGLNSNYPSTTKDALERINISKTPLVNQPKIPLKSHYKKSNNNPIPPVSNFVNYTSPHGNYFDSSLQKGGISKIKILKNKKPNKAISPVREYIRTSHQLTSNSLNHGRFVNSLG